MANFFDRSDKTVIADAGKLTLEEFVTKYKLTTGEEQLSKAYMQICKLHYKGVTVTAPAVVNVEKPIVTLKDAIIKTCSPPDREGKKGSKLTEMPIIIDDSFENVSSESLNEMKAYLNKHIPKRAIKLPVLQVRVKEKPKQASYLSERIQLRTTRITELLIEKVKPKDIIVKLAFEGIIVHAPQITAIAQNL